MNWAARSLVLSKTVRGVTPVLLVVSVFLTARGHNAPGGGFSGGLVMSAAVVLRFLADGRDGIRSLRFDPVVLTGVGLLVAIATAAVPLAAGEPLLRSTIWVLDVPAVGELKVVSSSLFDVGVHLLVLGAVTTVVMALVGAAESALDDSGNVEPPARPVAGGPGAGARETREAVDVAVQPGAEP